MSWWPMNQNEDEPEAQLPPKADNKPAEYFGPWTEQYFRVTLYLRLSATEGPDIPVQYSITVADYNMTALTDTLNSNLVHYAVDPTVPPDEEEEDAL